MADERWLIILKSIRFRVLKKLVIQTVRLRLFFHALGARAVY